MPGAGHDLDPPSERALSALIEETEGHEFTFVTDYPTTVRPFYHMRHAHDDTLTKSFDLLWRGIELTTGAQREHRYEQLWPRPTTRAWTPTRSSTTWTSSASARPRTAASASG